MNMLDDQADDRRRAQANTSTRQALLNQLTDLQVLLNNTFGDLARGTEPADLVAATRSLQRIAQHAATTAAYARSLKPTVQERLQQTCVHCSTGVHGDCVTAACACRVRNHARLQHQPEHPRGGVLREERPSHTRERMQADAAAMHELGGPT